MIKYKIIDREIIYTKLPKEIFNEIGNEWNYMPFSPNYKKIQNPNFFHFVGIVGKEIINKLQDKNINVEYFLKQLKNE